MKNKNAEITEQYVEQYLKQHVDPFVDQINNPLVRNVDNHGLGQVRKAGLVVDEVNEVNGPGAEELPGFIATRHELIEIARYWAKRLVELLYSSFCQRDFEDTARMKLILFASRRLSRLAKMLGKQNMDLIQQAYEECGVGQDAGVWKEFVTATFPRQAFHDESRKQS